MKKVTRDELFARFSEDLIHQRQKRKMAPMRALGEISSAELLVAFPKARDLKNEEHFQIWTAHLGISDGFPSGNRRKGQAPAHFTRTFDKSFQCDDQNVVIHWISLWKLIKTFFSWSTQWMMSHRNENAPLDDATRAAQMKTKVELENKWMSSAADLLKWNFWIGASRVRKWPNVMVAD